MIAANSRAWIGFSIALLLFAGLRALMYFKPASSAGAGSPDLDALRATQARLLVYTPERLQELRARGTSMRKELWTPATFADWRKASVPPGWMVQDLGPADSKQCRGHRYAFTRPGATSAHWTETLGLVSALENHSCVAVQKVSLVARPGSPGPRALSQCMIVAVFYFADDLPAPPMHGSS